MSDIQLQILVGPNKGKQLRLTQQRITFGRAPDNTLVVDQEHISRYHGELSENEDGELMLINHSANGTYLGRKLVRKKPRRVRDQETITIGDQALFQIALVDHPAAPSEDATEDATEEPTEGQPEAQGVASGSRRKLWLGIGVYLAVMLAVIVYFGLIAGGNSQGSGHAGPQPLTSEQIAEEIRELGPRHEQTPPNPVWARDFIHDANVALGLQDTDPAALYKAHLHYQRARAYSPEGRIGNLTHDASGSGGSRDYYLEAQEARELESKLIEKVQSLYDQAVTAYQAQDYRGARDLFNQLQSIYPATDRERDSRIYMSADEYLSSAKKRINQ